ncbi:YibE/F family protein [Peptoniphilus stercorisuis]|uniref:Membrane protein n=1 Tax=Peptoniphilus stercorisuis TaxID=1436965 RepID=A0ABS4KBR8_9FIRM|nr:YibE/F family protein [Peptoniphilus stercorisuis]MBP2025220.1 putative membrane protein [Peptoniphilus stercorisuis]
MKKLLFNLLLLFMFIPAIVNADSLSSDTDLKKHYDSVINNSEYSVIKAKIIDIEYDDTKEKRETPLESDIRYQHLKIKILNGTHKEEELTIRHTIERIMPGSYIFKQGDKILLRITENKGIIETIKIEEKVRDINIFLILLLFVILLLLFGKISGLKTLISLIFTIGTIILIYIPLILNGFSPILASILVSILSIVVTLLIISGNNKKTYVAIISTSIGVIFSGIIAILFGKFASLTGLSEDSAISLAYIPQYRNLNYQGILFGTILIGAIGAIMDVAISIASSLWEIKEINSNINKNEMIKSGFNIGRDILGSMSNTLILAYVGTTLHLIMLFIVYRVKFIEIINLDSIATEIIRAMAGSIGLIITIPITVLISTFVYIEKKPMS